MPDVINVSSVRDVYLKELFFHMDDENKLKMFKMFLEKFSCSEVNASEPFLHSIGVLQLLRIRWKRVVLGLRVFCQSCLLGVYQLMRSSKHLEELVIHAATELNFRSVCNTPNLFFSQCCHARTDLAPVELSDPCEISKLKTITLHGSAKPWEHLLQLIEFLLKSATVLEKLVIVPDQCGLTAVEKLDFVMHVSSFQRSSPSARVLFL
ncbi:uncharacterized protein LOC141642394 isoform X3 [Silene latifolia]